MEKVNQSKCNGLHSGTKFRERFDGRYTTEYHEHPETGELVEILSWSVPNGEDDVAFEFEVVGVYPPIICQISKAIEHCNRKILAY